MSKKNKKRRSSIAKGIPSLLDNFKDDLEVSMDQEINDRVWTCTVTLIVEKQSEYQPFITLFEKGANSGSRPVVKNITSSEIEKLAGKSKGILKGRLSNINSKAKLFANLIYHSIQQYRNEDMALVNSRLADIKKCKKSTPENSKRGIKSQHDEPLCGPNMYFVLTGFYDPFLPFELIKLKLPLELILAFTEVTINVESELSAKQSKLESNLNISDKNSSKFENHQLFWREYQDSLSIKENKYLTEGLIILDCDPKKGQTLEGNPSMMFDYVSKKMFEIQRHKREYIYFMSNINIIEVVEAKEINVEDLKIYCNLVQSVPIETATVDFILDSLCEQLNFDHQKSERQSMQESRKNGKPINDSEDKKNQNNSIKVNESIVEANNFTENNKTPFNLTPLISEYKNFRALRMSDCQDIYHRFNNYFIKILQGMICPLVWKLYPAPKKEQLFARSHLLKVNRFFKYLDVELLELCLYKRLVNKMILTQVNTLNIDEVLLQVIDGYLGCGRIYSDCYDQELSIEEEKSIETSKVVEEKTRNNYSESALYKADSTSDSEVVTEDSEKIFGKMGSIINKNDRLMNELYNFLTCPGLDNLFFHNQSVIDDYNRFEVFSKETMLNLLYEYSISYEYIDYVYYDSTDSILFLFHNGTDKTGFSHLINNSHLLTLTMGFRDYYHHIKNIHLYESWVKTRSNIIEKEDEEILKNFNVIQGEEENERCCLKDIKYFGTLHTEDDNVKQFQLHAPHPMVKPSLGDGNFFGYDLKITGLVHASEIKTFYSSKSGMKVVCQNSSFYDLEVKKIELKNENISIIYDFTSYNSQPLQKVIFQTKDGIKMIVSYHKVLLTDQNQSNHKDHKTNIIESILSSCEMVSAENTSVVVLPNGLEISPYIVDNEVIGVRQRYVNKDSNPNNLEKYRIFLQEGTVMIFMKDNSVKVYYLNTTITEISKLSEEKNFLNVCGDEIPKQVVFDNSSSAGKRKETYMVASEYKTLMWSGVVKYFKYDFCFKEIKEFKLKTACIPNEELFTFRTDGTKSILTCDGVLTVEYSDGTRITGVPKETIIMSEPDYNSFNNTTEKNLWVLIDMDYLLEEPNNYLPVRCIDNVWVVILPGNKEFTFSDPISSAFILDQSELTINYREKQLNYNTFDYQNFSNSTFTIFFEPEEEIVAMFIDEENKFGVDCRGNVQNIILASNKNDKSIEADNISNNWGFNSDNDFNASISVYSSVSKANMSNKDSSKENFVIPPSELQQNVKICILKRDLSGYELIRDNENENLLKYVAIPNVGTYSKLHYNNEYTQLYLWNLLPEGEILPYLKSLKVSYLNPESFTSSPLKKKNLSNFIPDNIHWLINSLDQSPPCSSFAHVSSSKRNEQTKSLKNRTVNIMRRIIDLRDFENLDNAVQDALRLYLDFKKKIYATILKNSVDEIKIKEKNMQDTPSKTQFINILNQWEKN